MTKPIAVYHARNGKEEFMFALSSKDNKVYRRDFKRHSRFGTRWDTWRETCFEDIVAMGHAEFKRIDKQIKVVLP